MPEQASAVAPPERRDDDLTPYFAGSPIAESFAPGMLDESDLVPMQLADETPWRRSSGHVPDMSQRQGKRRRRRGTAPEQETGADSASAAERQLVVQEPPPGAAPAPDDAAPNVTVAPQPALAPIAADGATRPVAAGDASHDARAPEELTPSLVDSRALRVLVVHPNLATRRQVAATLGDLGLEVSTCGEAEQAILQFLHDRPDAVVSEIGTPDLDALALCRSISERATGTPVLLVAPGDDEANYSLAMEGGAADYLRRPLTPQFLCERVRVAVQAARDGRLLRSENAALQFEVMAGQEGSRHLSRHLRRQELKIQSLFELSKNVFGCLELEELYQGFLLTAMGQLGLAAGVLFHLDSGRGGRVLEVVSRGIRQGEAERLLDFRAGLGAYLLRSPQPVVLGEDRCPHDLQPEVESLRRSGFAVACPMAAKGQPIGVALFGPKVSGGSFGVDDLVLLSAVCNFAGPALESARLYTELHRTYLSTVRAFISALEAKDTYTRGHSDRVADYARGLGETLGLKKRDLDMLVFGAVLHDIGKIGVTEGILNKPGPLTPEEWRVVRSHPEMGARIVGHIEYLEPAVGLILHHHERIDGRGYPHGLVGDDIELGARIITVADAFDAMTSERPYRHAMDVGQAVHILHLHAGRQFDRHVVDTFADCLASSSIAPGV